MILQQEKLPSLFISESGIWQLKTSWLLQPEKIPVTHKELHDWQSAVQEWLPDVGAKWRIPSDAPAGYTETDEWIVSSAGAEEINNSAINTFRVTVTAAPGIRMTVTKQSGTKEVMTEKGERFRSASWLVSDNALGGWLPAVGSPLNWEGGNFICCNIELKEIAPLQWQVRISAYDLDVEPPPEISFRRDRDFETEKYGIWRVYESALENFKKLNDINSTAPWAGPGYRIIDFKAGKAAAGICEVALVARDINVRLVGVTRKERFVSFSKKKKPRRKIFWESVWRVHKDALYRFANITGKSAKSWTGCSSVVTAAASRRLSDYEFEYILEAVPRKNNMYTEDDKSDLGGRVDISGTIVEMILSPEQCGWWRDQYGSLQEIPGWSSSDECPFETEKPLPKNLIEVPLKTLQVMESRYFKDKNFAIISYMDRWMAGSRVWFGLVDKQLAFWLKEEIYNELVVDDSGETWRKVTCIYRLPPAGLKWNEKYWNREQ